MRSAFVLGALLTLLLPDPALAQEPERESSPDQPDDVRGRALPPGHFRMPTATPQNRDRVTSEPSLPAGTVVAEIVDPTGVPVPGATVALEPQRGTTARRTATTDPGGHARWDGLPNTAATYRVMVTNDRARFGSEEFAASADGGLLVRVTRWPVTDSTSSLLLMALRTVIAVSDDAKRLDVTQAFMLLNSGQSAILAHHEIPLPDGYEGFQPMLDAESDRPVDWSLVERGRRVWLDGTLPPGGSVVTMGYVLPVTSRTMSIEQRLPFEVGLAEVLVQRIPGMDLEVAGMSPPTEVDVEGRDLLGTHLRRRPDSPPLRRLQITLRHLPGPSRARWIALLAAAVAVAAGFAARWSRARRPVEPATTDLGAERERLLAEASRLEKAKADGELDEPAYSRKRERILARLAEVLVQQGAVPEPASDSGASGGEA